MPAGRATHRRHGVQNHVLTDASLTADDEALLRSFSLALRAGWQRPVAESSVKTYLYGVRSLVRFLRAKGMPALTEVTREHLQEWAIALRADVKPRTARLYITAAHILFDWLVSEGERRDNPAERISAPPVPVTIKQPYTTEEIQRIIKSQNTSTIIGARNVALFLFLLDTGVRRAECAGIRLADVDWKHGRVKVMGKGSRERVVQLGAATQRALDTYLRRRARALPGFEWLWHAQGGGQLTGTRIADLHQALGKELGIHMHPHRWRHTAIQSWLDAGMHREEARMLSGHESEVVFRGYTRATDAQRALEAHRRLSPADQLLRKRQP